MYRAPAPFGEQSFFDAYQRFSEIIKFISDLASEKSDLLSLISIGKSFENRNLTVMKIGAKSNVSKPIIYIDAAIHAREWITTSTALYIANRLIHDYEYDVNIKKLMDTFDWYILPVANPDGYEYTHTRDRMWRKTRSATKSVWGCKGVDPNRNWDFHWNEVGASGSPCSEIYAGSKAFSEVETKAISKFILENKERMVAFITLHSYSQLWLTPWGFTTKLPDDYDNLVTKAKVAVTALSKLYGTKYKVGSSTNILYAAAGGSDDWAYGVAKIKYVYTVELRDRGNFGFLLPKSEIIPTGEETFDAITAMVSEIASEI